MNSFRKGVNGLIDRLQFLLQGCTEQPSCVNKIHSCYTIDAIFEKGRLAGGATFYTDERDNIFKYATK